jgi:hypothetical protein
LDPQEYHSKQTIPMSCSMGTVLADRRCVLDRFESLCARGETTSVFQRGFQQILCD